MSWQYRFVVVLSSITLIWACVPQDIPFQIPPFDPADTFFSLQWHLDNQGQLGGVPDEDINVLPVWTLDENFGNGIEVVVVDDGIDLLHQDLKSNLLATRSFNFADSSTDITGDSSDSKHGTAVAGIIAAEQLNTVGVRGVAPEASLFGFNLIAPGNTTTANVASAMNRDLTVDISNNSWGPEDDTGLFFEPDSTWELAIDDGTTNGRGGLGIVYLWAGGNGGTTIDRSDYDGFANYHGVIAIGAVDHNGYRASYSETGSNIWVVAPSEGTPASDYPGIMTTDVSGGGGYNFPGATGDVYDINYTANFNGTSAATPIVSGVVALMLAANPALTYRDVRMILAQTARQVDPLDAGWAKNNASFPVGGYNINEQYGFGAVDAEAAVNAAKTWTNIGAEIVETYTSSFAVASITPFNTAILNTVTVTSTLSQIEFVEIIPQVSHPDWGELNIQLIRSGGDGSTTTSTLTESRTCFSGFLSCSFFMSGDNFRFGSSRYLGETPNGDWTLQIIDQVNGVNPDGEWIQWQLKLYGH